MRNKQHAAWDAGTKIWLNGWVRRVGNLRKEGLLWEWKRWRRWMSWNIWKEDLIKIFPMLPDAFICSKILFVRAWALNIPALLSLFLYSFGPSVFDVLYMIALYLVDSILPCIQPRFCSVIAPIVGVRALRVGEHVRPVALNLFWWDFLPLYGILVWTDTFCMESIGKGALGWRLSGMNCEFSETEASERPLVSTKRLLSWLYCVLAAAFLYRRRSAAKISRIWY